MKVKTIRGSEINLVPGVQLDGEMLRDLDLRGIDLANSVLTKCFFNGIEVKHLFSVVIIPTWYVLFVFGNVIVYIFHKHFV